MNDGTELLSLVIEAHGGIERWNQLKEADIHVQIGGFTWIYKGQPDLLNDIHYRAQLHHQYGNYYPFVSQDNLSVFETGRVAIETKGGELIEELLHPRASFAAHTRESKWSKLQLVYFASYAMWNYLTFPFNFTLPGFMLQEVEPWTENGESWRRLEVTFPDYLETHSKKQTFYYGEDGLLRRHDYNAVVLGGVPAAHYVYNHKDFSGIMIPTKRRVYSRKEDNSFSAEPVFITIDILDVKLK
ncbi:hypothetical protein [Pedobacter westerhofensis]|nr:hypothetical protein [Pedobacter westerhofensis]